MNKTIVFDHRRMETHPNNPYWKNRHAVISGGSSGLGRHLVLALARAGAHIAIVARDRDRLLATRTEAIEAGAASVRIFSLDVCQPMDPQPIDPNRTKRELPTDIGDLPSWNAFIRSSPCDLLINAVGRSDRGLLNKLTADDLAKQFEINVLSALHMTQSCWGSLEQSRGVVTNIASLAGILAGPKLGGYCIAKHALVAMHRQWRSEAIDGSVHFLLICPGPIDRDASQERYADLIQARGLDPEVAKPGGGVQVRRLDPVKLSQRILLAAQARELEVIVPGKAKWLAALMPLWPSWADRILRKKMG
jgi:NAD(P)-dependent dehydrogenase (short-subunit alcohol dehydrogenase family)